MDVHGHISEELDIKIFILYVLSNLSGAVDSDTLYDLCSADSGISYFDFTEYLNDLVDSGHINVSDRGYRITDKGSKNAEAVSSSLPYSLRKLTHKRIEPVEKEIRRDAMIKTGHTSESGSCIVSLSLEDGEGELISLKLLCGSEKQASGIEERFRKDAESYYSRILNLFSEE